MCPFDQINEEFNRLIQEKNKLLEEQKEKLQKVGEALDAERAKVKTYEETISKLNAELDSARKILQECIRKEELRNAVREQLQLLTPKEFVEELLITFQEPLEPLKRIESRVKELIDETQEELFIFSPYIDNSLLPSIIKANDRGVRVRIITRSKEKMKKEQVDAISRLEQLSRERKTFMHKTSNMLYARMIGNEKAVLVSSADLDSTGLVNQIQAGIFSNNPRTVYNALKFFDKIWWRKEI